MADSVKRTECVKVCFEERLFLDLNREAIRQERKLADLLYLICRKYAYGQLTREAPGEEVTQGDRDAL